MGDRQIVKLRYKDGKVGIEYREERESGMDEFSLKSMDPPAQSLPDALQALKPHVVKMLELPDGYGDTMAVISARWSYTEIGEGVTITALKDLKDSNAPLVLNTPFTMYEAEEPQPCLTGECVAALEAVKEQAINYLEGERGPGSQAELPLEQETSVTITTSDGKKVTTSATQFAMANQVEEARETVRNLWGSQYGIKIMAPMATLRRRMRQENLSPIAAVTAEMGEDTDGARLAVLLAAAAEIIGTDAKFAKKGKGACVEDREPQPTATEAPESPDMPDAPDVPSPQAAPKGSRKITRFAVEAPRLREELRAKLGDQYDESMQAARKLVEETMQAKSLQPIAAAAAILSDRAETPATTATYLAAALDIIDRVKEAMGCS